MRGAYVDESMRRKSVKTRGSDWALCIDLAASCAMPLAVLDVNLRAKKHIHEARLS